MRADEHAKTAAGREMEGFIGSMELRPGIGLHWADILVRQRIKQKVVVPSGVSLIIVLAGSCRYGWSQREDKDDVLCTTRCGGALLARVASGKLVRELQPGETLKHIGLSLSPEWLDQSRIQNVWQSLPLEDKTSHYWPLSERIHALCEELFTLLRQQTAWKTLRLESCCLALLAECLHQQGSTAPLPICPLLSRRQRTRLQAVRAFLESEAAMTLSLADIAKRFATNPTSLQQQFRQLFGVTVFTVLREAKMRHARQMLMRGISVAEASRLTGFANPSSFCVAFKKRFSLSPSQYRTLEVINVPEQGAIPGD